MESIFKYGAILITACCCAFGGIGLYNTINKNTNKPEEKKQLTNDTKPKYSYPTDKEIEELLSKNRHGFSTEEERLAELAKRGQPEPKFSTSQSRDNKTPYFDNFSVRQYENKNRKKKNDIFNSLQSTCNYWTKEYNKSRSERSRLFMNSGCEKAADYAKNELNLRYDNPNHVAFQPKQRSGVTLISLNNDTKGKSTSGQCSRWARELERINKRLDRGYNEPSGNSLRRRRHELNSLLRRQC